jgi:hypothetical protein
MKGKSRLFIRDWHNLEIVLFEWQQHTKQKKAIIIGEILKTKARQL